MIDAKTAHRLAREQWERLQREKLAKKLDAIQEHVIRAIKAGDFTLSLPYGTLDDGDLWRALEALGYWVNTARTKRYKDRISWCSPKERKDA